MIGIITSHAKIREREEKSRIYVYYMPAKGQGEAKFLPMIYECNCDLDILFLYASFPINKH